MRKTEKGSLEKRRVFCRTYLATMDAGAAARAAEIADGEAFLEKEAVQRELQRMRLTLGDVRREDVVRRLCAIAFAPGTDAVRLAYLDKPSGEELAELDLSMLTEFRHNSAGSVELRFADRIKALETLWKLLEGAGEDDAPEAFFRALEEAGEEHAP